MQTAFGSAFGAFDQFATESNERRLLEALRVAVAEISIKELAFKLDVSPSLLSDALSERANKGVRASWLITILDMASEDHAIEIIEALIGRRLLEVNTRVDLTPEQLNERYEEKLRSLGPIGLQLIRDARGGRP